MLSLVAATLLAPACTSEEGSPGAPTDTDGGASNASDEGGSSNAGNEATGGLTPLPSAKATQVVAGANHACALTTEGAVRA